MIRHSGARGEHLIRVDRIVLLRKLVALTEQHDALLAEGLPPDDQVRPGQSFDERAEHLRREVVSVLRRLGLPAHEIARATARGLELPRLSDAARAEAAAATNEGDQS